MNFNYRPQLQPRSAIERVLDSSFYWAAKVLAMAVAGVLIWITIQVALAAQPAIAE